MIMYLLGETNLNFEIIRLSVFLIAYSIKVQEDMTQTSYILSLLFRALMPLVSGSL